MTEERGLVKYEARDGQQVTLSFDTIKRYLVQGHAEMVTQQELMFFMGTCKSRGLNPFNKDCYLIKYSAKQGAAIITAVDYFRKRAKAQRDCHGWQKGIIVERNGAVVYSKGLMLNDDILLGGWFKAQPEGWTEPFELEVNLQGYIKKKNDGSITKFWAKDNQPSQIAKVAESQGLRTLWPDEFQQLYTPEEMGEPDSFKSSESIITDKAADLTDKIKGEVKENGSLDPVQDLKHKPKLYAQDLKDRMDEGDRQHEGYQDLKTEPEMDNNAKLVLAKDDPLYWLSTCRPGSSVAANKDVISDYEKHDSEVAMLADRDLRSRIDAKYNKAKAMIAALTPTPESGDKTPERMEFEKKMGEYFNIAVKLQAEETFDTILQEKMGVKSINEITAKVDEDLALGLMAEKFGG